MGTSDVSKDVKDLKDVKDVKDLKDLKDVKDVKDVKVVKDCLTKPLSKMKESDALQITKEDLKELEEYPEFKDIDLGELKSSATFYFADPKNVSSEKYTAWQFEDGPILKIEDLSIYNGTYSLCILHGCSENIQITELSHLSLLCKSHRAEVYEKYNF